MIDHKNAWGVVCKCVGRQIASIHRVYNVLHGEIQEENLLPLQINFEDGQIVLFDEASDGTSLIAKETPWRDPFAGSLDREAQDYIDEYGQWTLIDVSNKESYRDLVGRIVQAVYPIRTIYDVLSGVQFQFGDLYLSFTVCGDYCEVWFGSDHALAFEKLLLLVDYELGYKDSNLAQE